MSKLERSVNAVDGPVAEELVGEVWPSAEPGEDPVLYGYAVLEPRDPVEVRSDNPVWVSVYTEDGFQAWSSPIFVYREEG